MRFTTEVTDPSDLLPGYSRDPQRIIGRYWPNLSARIGYATLLSEITDRTQLLFLGSPEGPTIASRVDRQSGLSELVYTCAPLDLGTAGRRTRYFAAPAMSIVRTRLFDTPEAAIEDTHQLMQLRLTITSGTTPEESGNPLYFETQYMPEGVEAWADGRHIQDHSLTGTALAKAVSYADALTFVESRLGDPHSSQPPTPITV